MDELATNTQEDILWCILFADDTILKIKRNLDYILDLELWRKTLADKIDLVNIEYKDTNLIRMKVLT